jgi:hypothetical protein
MPASLVTSLLSKPSIKIIDERTNTIRWQNIKVRSVEIAAESENTYMPLSAIQINAQGEYKKLLEADLQTGKIIRPHRIKVAFWSPDISTTNSVIQSFLDQEATLQVTSKSMISDSMVIISLEIEQTPENITASLLTMELEQAIGSAKPDNFVAAQPADQPTRGVRLQSPVSITKQVGDLYNKVAKTIGILP